ncbi:hypothetical protein SAMN04489729_5000 [Amycolatopsis lurida]|uniref:ESX-1 secretion-associated protein n=1 Tax=Amycolatopsis lurida NRRL 2430 TaxID=1460371 RepID=A0A2P2FQZ1_AMYLU|nr:hypothetical protein [Amycolatopsis lurida]KFU79144.1 hypothetical protein BB31_22670 [Amycolatopsis lurida NRRL 2430]SED70762.1 hypothetical protein SAMN04489729_5000 [Amycolatopsis lurida]
MGQPQGSEDFKVDPAELAAHRNTIDYLGQRVAMTGSAADAAMGDEAFGLVGIPLAAICATVQSLARSAIESAVEASADHADRVHTWQQRKQMQEDEFKSLFKVED